MKTIIENLTNPQIAWDFREKRLVVIAGDNRRLYYKDNELSQCENVPFITDIKMDFCRREVGLNSKRNLVRIQDSKVFIIAFDNGNPVEDVRCVAVHSNGLIYFATGDKAFYILPEELDPIAFTAADNLQFTPSAMVLSKDESQMFFASGDKIWSLDVKNDATLGGRTRLLTSVDGNVVALSVDNQSCLWVFTEKGFLKYSEGGTLLMNKVLPYPICFGCFADGTVYVADEKSVSLCFPEDV